MSSHFRWYPSSDEMVVPFMAQYAFPSQANKSVKMTPRISPKTGFVFTPGNVIRLEFPAQVNIFYFFLFKIFSLDVTHSKFSTLLFERL